MHPLLIPAVEDDGDPWARLAFLGSAEARHLDPDPGRPDAIRAAVLLQGAAERRLPTTTWTPSSVATMLLDWWSDHPSDADDPQRWLTVLRALVMHAHATREVPRTTSWSGYGSRFEFGYRAAPGLGSTGVLISGRRRTICERRDDLLSILRRRGFDVTAELLDTEPASQSRGWC